MSRDRDRILEQALKHELRAATPPAGECLDAETLGAWMDDGLDATAAATAEAHISNCARCQSLVATMARGTLTTEAVAGTLGTQGTLGTPGTQGTLSWWKWALAPLAAGVTAVTLWMVIPEQQRIATAPPQAKQSAPPETIAPAPAPGAPGALEAPAAAGARADQRFVGRNAARDARAADPGAAEKKEEAAPPRERTALADAAASAGARAEATPPASPMPPPAAAAAPAPPAAGAIEAAAAPQIALQKSTVNDATVRFEVPTLRPSIRWRVVGDFFVELTLDSGASWIRKHQLPGITAGSAPSALVCWFAGSNGSVWLTTDGGATFRNVGIAEPLDIASISATNALSAQIFTVSGRRFQTSDAGRTWQPF